MNPITDVHRLVAYTIPAAFAVLVLLTIYSFIRNRPPSDWFWRILAYAQVVLGLQVIVGGILFLAGSRPASNGPQWLHYVYGALFPALVLVVAHRYARKMEAISWLVFGVAAFLCFGLTFRALQTGLGID